MVFSSLLSRNGFQSEVLPDDRQLPAQPVLPAELHLLPLTEKPFFPAQTLPLLIARGFKPLSNPVSAAAVTWPMEGRLR